MRLRSKLTLEICQKIGNLDEKKNRTKLSQSGYFEFSFSKNCCTYLKSKNTNCFFFVLKLSIRKNVMCLR